MKSFSLKELAEIIDAKLIGDPGHIIKGVNTLDDALHEDLSFLSNPRYAEAMRKTQAGAVCIDQNVERADGKNYLISPNPSAAFQKIANLLLLSDSTSGFTGIHPTATIHETASIGKNVTIGPSTCIDRDTIIGDETTIGPNVTIAHEVQIGNDCTIFSNCTIREKCILKNRIILQPGAVIGSCGFGYIQDKLGRHVKLEQLGVVILEDDVEIGANTTVDRSRFKVTLVRRGTKIDNLCQIGHNVEIGEYNILAAQTGVAGSSKTGKYCMFGGQVGILGHVELEDMVLVGSRGGISKSLKSGRYRGSPALPVAEFNRQEVYSRKVREYAERIKALEKKIALLESK